ncbi:TrbG/VirB9 family P-type conjugative transfer protein [Allosphingosinicella deserti]|uniref:Type VI secretion protein n=1 Tax=Allosphingosinicella deserti TaxID=2116704 RepID=A0A2P7QEK1_9SPHN|nr:TrbG/VirB9 family P-type conjugative transfer protein [Sphingomonas deserti]PSJ36402.1 type VI secretion protein [Sphingomonas deserti]
MRLAAAMLITAFVSAPLAAQVRPQPDDGNPRLQSIDFIDGQVVLLETALGYQLTVELAPDEQIENVAVGESGAWQVTANRRGDRLFIKPLQAGVVTNMTVITSARSYFMDLVALAEPTPETAYSVRFRYPAPADEMAAAPGPATATGRYRLEGDRALRPVAISDDGIRTYLSWRDGLAIPAVYGTERNGTESLVNGMMREDVFVIDAVYEKLVFRIDRATASAERVRPRGRR